MKIYKYIICTGTWDMYNEEILFSYSFYKKDEFLSLCKNILNNRQMKAKELIEELCNKYNFFEIETIVRVGTGDDYLTKDNID